MNNSPSPATELNRRLRHWLLVVLPWLTACSGGAKLNFISLNTNAIDPPRVAPFAFDAQDCYWWIDSSGEFNIAMQCRKGNLLLGRLGDVEIDLSLALDGPPAGSGRDYSLRQRETRIIVLSPAGNERFMAHTGICDVLTQKDGSYRGSYRIWATPLTELNVLSILPQRPGPVLCFGTFHAVRNEERGRAIREKSESGGWMRPPKKPAPATSQPTTLPVAKP